MDTPLMMKLPPLYLFTSTTNSHPTPHQQPHFSATGRHWAPPGATSHKRDPHRWSLLNGRTCSCVIPPYAGAAPAPLIGAWRMWWTGPLRWRCRSRSGSPAGCEWASSSSSVPPASEEALLSAHRSQSQLTQFFVPFGPKCWNPINQLMGSSYFKALSQCLAWQSP